MNSFGAFGQMERTVRTLLATIVSPSHFGVDNNNKLRGEELRRTIKGRDRRLSAVSLRASFSFFDSEDTYVLLIGSRLTQSVFTHRMMTG